MDEYEKYHKMVQTDEDNGQSFSYIDTDSKNLIVSFGSANHHGGFDRKTSLCKLKTEFKNVDILYLRNMDFHYTGRGRHRRKMLVGNWYLGGLSGIGKNINHTISFLKKIFKKYENIICTGSSMGGYASILFGSILNANYIIAGNAQTDLEYVLKHTTAKNDGKRKISQLEKRKKECPKTWDKYANLAPHLNETTIYKVFYSGSKPYLGNKAMGGHNGWILHSTHHLENISKCKLLEKFDSDVHYSNFIEKITECLKT